MSGGTPIGAGYMRQRHSQGHTSSGEDLEDDACSRPIYQSPSSSRSRRWVEILENLLWISSVIFIMYYGDRRSNFIYLLWHDDRIKRIPLYVGLIGVGLNVLFFFYTSIIARGLRKSTEKWDASSTPALPFFTVIGILSFCLFCFALWPIWSFLTLPLVVEALSLLSQQGERHLLESNVNAALQKKIEELQRNLLRVTNEKVKALMELAQLKQEKSWGLIQWEWI